MADDLLSKLERAEGTDREIDAALVKAFCPGALISQYLVGDDEPSVFHAQALGISDKSDVPAFTASLDAALALVERVVMADAALLPSDRRAKIKRLLMEAVNAVEANWLCSERVARALCIALLRAVKASEQTT